MSNQNKLSAVAQYALGKVKTASAEESIPFAMGNHGYGTTNPDPSQAYMSMSGEKRSALNAMNFQDGSLQGSNLADLKNAIPLSFPVLADAAFNAPVASPTNAEMGKTASYPETREQFMQKMANTGHFTNVVPWEPAQFEQIEKVALQKTASEYEIVLSEMRQRGEIPTALIPIIFGS